MNEFQRQMRKALADRAKAARGRRGRHRRNKVEEETVLVRINSRAGSFRRPPPGPPAAA